MGQKGTKNLKNKKGGKIRKSERSPKVPSDAHCGAEEISKIILGVFRSLDFPGGVVVNSPSANAFCSYLDTLLSQVIVNSSHKSRRKALRKPYGTMGECPRRGQNNLILSSVFQKLRKMDPACAHRPESWHRR